MHKQDCHRGSGLFSDGELTDAANMTNHVTFINAAALDAKNVANANNIKQGKASLDFLHHRGVGMDTPACLYNQGKGIVLGAQSRAYDLLLNDPNGDNLETNKLHHRVNRFDMSIQDYATSLMKLTITMKRLPSNAKEL